MFCLDYSAGVYTQAVNPPTEYTQCTYILVSPSELQNQSWALTAQDGQQIGLAIITIWAIGFAFRAVATFLKSNGEPNE